MGLFGDVLSFVTTIGRIAGALSGELGSSLVFRDFGLAGGDTSVEPSLGQAVFFNDSNGATMVLNNSTTSTLGLFFTGDANTPPNQLFVPPASKFPISSFFQTFSSTSSDEFTIIPANPPDGNSNLLPIENLPVPDPGDPPGPGPNAVIAAQAIQPIPAGVVVSVGNLTVQINATARTIIVGIGAAFTLASIVLLNIRGAGDTFIRILNVLRPSAGGVLATDADDLQHMTVPIPQGIDISNGLTYLDVCVAVGGLQGVLQAWIEDHADLISPVNDEDRARLASFAAARKQ